MLLLASAGLFSKLTSSKYSFRNTISVSKTIWVQVFAKVISRRQKLPLARKITCALGNFPCFYCLLTFFQINFLKNLLSKHTQCVKQFGSRSVLTFCWFWSGSKVFAKVISRWQKLPLARKMWGGNNKCLLGNFPYFYCLLTFFKINFLKNFFPQHNQFVKRFGSRSGPTFCWSWSGSKVFAKVIRPTLKNVGLPCSYLPTQNRPYPQKIIAFLKFFSNYFNKPFFKIIKSCTLFEERLQRLLLYAFLPYIQHL